MQQQSPESISPSSILSDNSNSTSKQGRTGNLLIQYIVDKTVPTLSAVNDLKEKEF
jgi:hypothetical protein